MNALKTALEEIYGLFVDDGSYALAIIACLLVAGIVFTRLHISSTLDWRGPGLFVGLSAVMLGSVANAAKKRSKK